MLPVLLLALLFGFALNAGRQAGQRVQEFMDGLAHVLFRILTMIMRLAPAGAFGAMAFTVGRFGIRSIGSLGMLMVSSDAACLLVLVYACSVRSRACTASRSRGYCATFAKKLSSCPQRCRRSQSAAPHCHAGTARLRQGDRRARAARRLLLQPRRHGNLSAARFDVHRSSVRRPPFRRTDRDDARGHAAQVEGRGGRIRQRAGRARRDPRRHPRYAAGGCRAAGRYRSLHVRGARLDECARQCLRGDLRIDVGARL